MGREMTPYFTAISFINFFTLVMMIISIIGNSSISYFQRSNFLKTCITVFVICVMEILTMYLDEAPVKWRWLHILSNFIGFSITPLILVFLGNALRPYKSKSFKILIIFWGIYVIWMIVTLAMGNRKSVFYVDSNNKYYRAEGFSIHIVVYSFNLIYFFMENIFLSIRFWQNNKILLFANFIFAMTGNVIQVLYPEIQITWVCSIISILIYYLYYSSLYQGLDMQTYLLNYTSFDRWRRMQKKDVVLVIVEIDNFTKLKLNYSREQIDKILVSVSRLFNDFYKKYGRCYRISSEEFCVVIDDTKLDVELLNKQFFIEVAKYNFDIPDLPLVSIGYALLAPKEDINIVFSSADVKKRAFMKERIGFLY